MPTLHQYRLHAIIPAARVAAVNTWIKANLNPEGGDWLTPSLSATGNAPYTYAHCSAALTVPEIKLILTALAAQAGRTLPADWDSRTRAQRKAWLVSARNAIDSNSGIYLTLSDNDGEWDRVETALSRKGLQTAVSLAP